jgi:hypothetical protein
MACLNRRDINAAFIVAENQIYGMLSGRRDINATAIEAENQSLACLGRRDMNATAIESENQPYVMPTAQVGQRHSHRGRGSAI